MKYLKLFELFNTYIDVKYEYYMNGSIHGEFYIDDNLYHIIMDKIQYNNKWYEFKFYRVINGMPSYAMQNNSNNFKVLSTIKNSFTDLFNRINPDIMVFQCKDYQESRIDNYSKFAIIISKDKKYKYKKIKRKDNNFFVLYKNLYQYTKFILWA